MNHLDLFSGIGGFALAASWVWGEEHRIISFVEINPFCRKVLRKHWPEVPIINDVRWVRGKKIKEKIDLLTGGFPCQPFSSAGKRRGKDDDRYLWPEMFRVIREIRPRWIIAENVGGFVGMELEGAVIDLEEAGYQAEPIVIPACAVDAPHRRDRIWILAHSDGDGCHGEMRQAGQRQNVPQQRPHSDGKSFGECGGGSAREKFLSNLDKKRFPVFQGGREQILLERSGKSNGGYRWKPEPAVVRVVHGLPDRVDRVKALGEAIVPQVVVPIMAGIKEIEEV